MSIFEDSSCNPDYKIKFVLAFYRFGSLLYLRKGSVTSIPYFFVLFFYRVIVEWILGVELPLKTSVGRRLSIYHGVGLVVHLSTVIGDDVTLRNGVILGNSGGDSKGAPVILNRVDIGGNAVVIGSVKIGAGAKIGAGVVVTRDVPENSTVVSARNRYL